MAKFLQAHQGKRRRSVAPDFLLETKSRYSLAHHPPPLSLYQRYSHARRGPHVVRRICCQDVLRYQFQQFRIEVFPAGICFIQRLKNARGELALKKTGRWHHQIEPVLPPLTCLPALSLESKAHHR